MDIIYKNFLKENKVYRPNIAYWHRQIKRMLKEAHIDLEREKYLADRFHDGTLFFDGNPIFNAWLKGSNKAFRIIQEDPEEFEDYYASFKKEITISGIQYEELVIVLTLSRTRREKALTEIKEWLKS
ncbi:hypothetical protein [Shewanella chilikensis]|uniref:hypothetical protein n=1 Tax=Shewanella chilikensis TaxID=558541 RepID=UPI001CFA40B7|nr:hypothetical protein [Shewanella chilikensis]